MDEQNVVYHTMECYLALKGNEVLTHTITWLKLEKHAKCNKPDTKG